MWFAAHVVLYFKFKDGNQDRFPAWENVYLVEATAADEAFEKASALGRAQEGDDSGSLLWGGRPATRVFGGIRKLIDVQGAAGDSEDRPADGAEVTYSLLVVKDAKAFARLVEGKPVTVRYKE
jgi:hypothetical protein